MATHPPFPTPLPPSFGQHGKCGAWWTGHSRQHCAAPGCCRTFSSETAAERHRKTVDGRRVCVDPATVGLVPNTKPWGTCWSLPGAADRHWNRSPETTAQRPPDAPSPPPETDATRDAL